MESIIESIKLFYETNVVGYFNMLMQYPIKIVALIVDLFLVGCLFHIVMKLLKGTRAMQLVKGIIVLIVAIALSDFFSLNVLHYILSSISTYGVIMVIVIFQPELRRALEQMGSTDIRKLFDFEQQDESFIDRIVIAIYKMAKEKTGALIVFEREMSLDVIVATGVKIDSKISSELVENIFVPDTPLHDGAMVIRDGRIASAACILPLTTREDLDREYGTRHRAAIGLSEQYDSIVVVVSEETGKVSLVINGKIIRGLKEDALTKELKRRLERKTQKTMQKNMQEIKQILYKGKEKITSKNK
ncbi:MAG: diadenylate cyclase CdaA [Clostridia bacterium]|nr:diadenylate cyclase CdaA [Clostridia bacterium]